MNTYTPEIIALAIIAIAVVVLRLWISRQKDVSAARRRVRDIGLWVVAAGALALSGAGLLFPALRPTSPVGFIVAFVVIYLIASQRRSFAPTPNKEHSDVA